jgi:hypothetical protein
MRHAATLISDMEGISRTAFQIALELSQNSRSGLTTRFIAKKLEYPEEEIEYLCDLHHNLFFGDLTKVKLVAEGANAVKRISLGLENRGDIPALFKLVKALSPTDFRQFEEQLGIEKPGTKKAATELMIETHYQQPDSIVEYVATRGFSTEAQEVFDLVWQSKAGVMPIASLRAASKLSDFKLEQALAELASGLALFEMYRFDAQERLVRVVGILAEVRQWRESSQTMAGGKARPKPVKEEPEFVDIRGVSFTDTLCQIIAAIAARPVRLRSNGEPFREDGRRLAEIVDEADEPSLSVYLWVGQEVGWLARVDNELRAADLEALIDLAPVERHRLVCEWVLANGNEPAARAMAEKMLEEIKPDAWYRLREMTGFVVRAQAAEEQPVLKHAGGHWRYLNPSVAGGAEKALTRALEETYGWLGLVDQGECGNDLVFRVSDVGWAILGGQRLDKVASEYPPRGAEFVVQPNFDIVVPTQEVDPLLTVPLEQFCTRESAGAAVVYRLSKDSFTRAVQEGHDGQAFLSFLLRHNRGGDLPANVLQTLEDWRGGMKRVRVRTLHVIESDDPLVIAELRHRRGLKDLVEPIDGNRAVAFQRTSKTDLLKNLEKEGFVVS